MCVTSPLPRIAPAFAQAVLHRSWLLCAIWSLLLFTDMALLRLLPPDGPCHPILIGLSLGCSIRKLLSLVHSSLKGGLFCSPKLAHCGSYLQSSANRLYPSAFSGASLCFLSQPSPSVSLSLLPCCLPLSLLFPQISLSCEHSQALPPSPSLLWSPMLIVEALIKRGRELFI